MISCALLCLSGLLAAQPVPADLERRFREGDEAARLKLLRSLETDDPMVAKQVMPLLMRALGDESPAVRAGAADSLIHTKAIGSPAIPALCKCLEDPDIHVRRRAATAISNIARQPEVAIPALRKALRDPDFVKNARESTVPHAAAMALGDYGPAAQEAFADLLHIVKTHEDKQFRGCALIALGQIKANPDQVIAEALVILDDPREKDLWSQAMGSLYALGEKGKAAVPALLARFADTETRIGKQQLNGEQDMILRTIVTIEPDNQQFLNLLERILKDHEYNWFYRNRAAICLGKIGMRAKPYLPALAVALSDESELETSVFNTMRPFKDDAVSALTQVMRMSNGKRCIRCIKAICIMGKCATIAIGDLEKRLTDPDPDVRAAAEKAIGIIKMSKD
jgi:HEAT repeat protein